MAATTTILFPSKEGNVLIHNRNIHHLATTERFNVILVSAATDQTNKQKKKTIMETNDFALKTFIRAALL